MKEAKHRHGGWGGGGRGKDDRKQTPLASPHQYPRRSPPTESDPPTAAAETSPPLRAPRSPAASTSTAASASWTRKHRGRTDTDSPTTRRWTCPRWPVRGSPGRRCLSGPAVRYPAVRTTAAARIDHGAAAARRRQSTGRRRRWGRIARGCTWCSATRRWWRAALRTPPRCLAGPVQGWKKPGFFFLTQPSGVFLGFFLGFLFFFVFFIYLPRRESF